MHYTTNCNTQSNAPKDVRDQRPKYVELIAIINKLLLLHLVGVMSFISMMNGQANIKLSTLFVQIITKLVFTRITLKTCVGQNGSSFGKFCVEWKVNTIS